MGSNKMLLPRYVEDIEIGAKETFSKTITEADIILFAGLSGDYNPVHMDEEFAKTTTFNSRIAHGVISIGLISTTLTNFLGPGTIYISQNVKFTAPVRIGDTITAEVEVLDKNVERNRVHLKTTCKNQTGKLVIDGEAVCMPPKKK